MAYELTALIGDLELLRTVTDLAVIPLAQGKGLVPLTGAFWREHGRQPQPLIRGWECREAPDDEVDDPEERRVKVERAAASFAWIAGRCMKLSARPGAALGYVEAEFFGGAGRQAAVVWEAGVRVLEVVVEEEAINRALARVGVERAGFIDEFAALELGRFRRTDGWLEIVRAL